MSIYKKKGLEIFSSDNHLAMAKISTIMATFLVGVLVTLIGFTPLVLAQEPPVVEISIAPGSEYAVTGQVFTYTVTITNTRPEPLTDIIVLTEIPTKTTFANTHQHRSWLVGAPPPNETGLVVWNPTQALAPEETAILELAVNVPPEIGEQQITSREYTVISEANGDILAVSSAIQTQVVRPTPTPTATPSPLPTASPELTPAPTGSISLSRPALPVEQTDEAAIARVTAPTSVTPLETQVPATTSSPVSNNPVVIVIIVLIVISSVIGLARFFKR